MIDSHQHFWRLDRGDYDWLTPELAAIYRDFGPADLGPILAHHGIEGTVLVQAAASVGETEYMLSVAAGCSFVKGVVGWVDFQSSAVPRVIERLARDRRLKGLRPMIQDIADPDWMLNERLKPAIDAMQACGLRFDALLKPRHLKPFERFRQLYPDLPIVIDHGAKPEIAFGRFSDWAAEMRNAAGDRRVFCKLSGLVTEGAANWKPGDLTRYIDLLLETFGPARLMWGSDWPVVNLAGGYDRWREATMEYVARLTVDERASILGDAARAFYDL